jgi:hypothetical protein
MSTVRASRLSIEFFSDGSISVNVESSVIQVKSAGQIASQLKSL